MKFHADHAVGILFLMAGGAAVSLGLDYGFGNLSEMGAGGLPVLLGAVLFVFGIVLLGRSVIANNDAEIVTLMPRLEVRPFLSILAALLAFGLLVERVGLLPGMVALICIGWLADKRGRLKELPFLIVTITAVTVGIFYFGLGIPFYLVKWGA